jgi:flavin-dependent dehydrogenase
MSADHYDVVIVGGGLAGLSLARQLLRTTDKKILLLERREAIPSTRKKVGESLVQVGGFYFGKVLDLEEYLFREHYMKYNLRFYWKTAGRANSSFEDYSQAYIRAFSNIPCYQLDRNKLEEHLCRLNCKEPNFTLCASAIDLEVELAETGPHTLRFASPEGPRQVRSEWVVDTTGRRKLLARQLELTGPNAIRHGSSFLWVDGLVDIDQLTELSPRDLRLKKARRATGHLPTWLATNHFMGEGFWFWVIPLQGQTSLGLVYDSQLIDADQVNTPDKLVRWICREFPLFERDLPRRRILDRGFLRSFSHGCTQTIHPSKWALSGESGRFSDPLYSPGSDFIAVHNTLIADAILCADATELAAKCKLYEVVMQALYESLLPTYATSYDTLGDQEAFSLKYTWELSVYFGFFVFPFINDLITDRRFIIGFLNRFARLGAINRNLQSFISAYYQWKKVSPKPVDEPVFYEFTNIGALRTAESTFYEIGVSVDEARQVLDEQLENLEQLARYIVTYIHAAVLKDEGILVNRPFVESIDFKRLSFDPDQMQAAWAALPASTDCYDWPFDPYAIGRQFHPEWQKENSAGASGADWMRCER